MIFLLTFFFTTTVFFLFFFLANATQSLVKPTIIASPQSYMVVGHPFTLECMVHHSEAVTFRWNNPQQKGPVSG